MWRDAVLVAGKDLRIEARSRVALWQVLPFAALSLVLFAFALGPGPRVLRQAAPGLFWLAVCSRPCWPPSAASPSSPARGPATGCGSRASTRPASSWARRPPWPSSWPCSRSCCAPGSPCSSASTSALVWLAVVASVLATVGLAAAGVIYGALSAGSAGPRDPAAAAGAADPGPGAAGRVPGLGGGHHRAGVGRHCPGCASSGPSPRSTWCSASSSTDRCRRRREAGRCCGPSGVAGLVTTAADRVAGPVGDPARPGPGQPGPAPLPAPAGGLGRPLPGLRPGRPGAACSTCGGAPGRLFWDRLAAASVEVAVVLQRPHPGHRVAVGPADLGRVVDLGRPADQTALLARPASSATWPCAGYRPTPRCGPAAARWPPWWPSSTCRSCTSRSTGGRPSTRRATVLNPELTAHIHGSMAWTLLLGFVAITLVFVWMVAVRYRIEVLRDAPGRRGARGVAGRALGRGPARDPGRSGAGGPGRRARRPSGGAGGPGRRAPGRPVVKLRRRRLRHRPGRPVLVRRVAASCAGGGSRRRWPGRLARSGRPPARARPTGPPSTRPRRPRAPATVGRDHPD